MSTDPDIQARWDRAVRTLAALIRPHLVQEHRAEEFAREFVIGHLSVEGWRPPLRRLPDVIREGRRRALDRPPP